MSLLARVQHGPGAVVSPATSRQGRIINGHAFTQDDIAFLKSFTRYPASDQESWKDGQTYWHKDSYAQCGIGYRKVQDASIRQGARYEWVFHTTERGKDVYCTFDNPLMGCRFNSKLAMHIWRGGGRALRDVLYDICRHYPQYDTAAYVVQLHDMLLANQKADWNIYDIINGPQRTADPLSTAIA